MANTQNEIPATAREFERWMAAQTGWPDDLVRKGKFALLTLQQMRGQEHKFQEGVARDSAIRDLLAFAEAYGAWKAREQR